MKVIFSGWSVPLVAASLLMMFPASPLGAAVVNLTNVMVAGEPQSSMAGDATSFVGGMINGALYRRPVDADDSNAGSGIFRDLYTLQTNGVPEAGYNRDGVIDSAVANGFDPVITMSDLVEDSTGTAYVFVVDTNEPGSPTEKFISLDDFKIYIGGTTDPDPLPQSLFDLGSELGVPAYDMNQSGQDNHVLLDYSLFSGSGAMDLFVFVPKVFFAGATMDQQVFIYSQFGAYTGAAGFDPAAGPEQVSLPGKAVTGTVDPLLDAVPEPGALALLALAAGVSLRRRR